MSKVSQRRSIKETGLETLMILEKRLEAAGVEDSQNSANNNNNNNNNNSNASNNKEFRRSDTAHSSSSSYSTYGNEYHDKSDFNKFIRAMVLTKGWSLFFQIVIFCDVVVTAVSSPYSYQERHSYLLGAFQIPLLVLYTFEAVCKIYGLTASVYFNGNWTRFDFLLLSLFYLTVVGQAYFGNYSFIKSERMLRSLKSLRTLRWIAMNPNLKIVALGVFKSTPLIARLLIIVGCMIFIFGVLFYYLVGSSVPSDWGTLGRSMFSLCVFMTFDNWTDWQHQLDIHYSTYTRILTYFYMSIAAFLFANMFIAVVIDGLEEARQEQQAAKRRKYRVALNKKKQYFIAKERQQKLQNVVSEQCQSLNELIQKTSERLRHTTMTAVIDIHCNRIWMETYMAALNCEENTKYRNQQLHFEMVHTISAVLESNLSDTETMETSNYVKS